MSRSPTPTISLLPPSRHVSPEPAPEYPPININHSVSIETANTPYSDSPHSPTLSPLITPSLLPLPPSPDSSSGLASIHPPVIPTTPTHWNQSVSNEGGNTPYTPLYIPLPPSPDSPPGHAPKHPPITVTIPNRNQSVPVEGDNTPYLDSSYLNYSPFIPQLSPTATPGVFLEPFSLPPQIQPKVDRRGLSEDFPGYPRYPTAAPQPQPPMSAFGSHPSSPHSAPSEYQGFYTPWVSNTAQLPSTPWSAPQQLPSQGFSPTFGSYGPLPHMTSGQGYPGWPGVAASYPRYYGPPYPSPWVAQPSPFDHPPYTSKLPDHMDPFMEGKDYGAVLDPFLIKVLRVDVRLNPLITPLLEAESDRVHLIWNMLFPTSMVQRSTDPSHISWMEGRDSPATFPRISSLSIVSDTIPWVLNVEAKDSGIGVTCGEVIDSIGNELGKFSYKRDYKRLTPGSRSEVGESYYRNRSREFGVPGGRLGQGMKRLDFLCEDTMFAGIEIDDLVVKRVCGEVLPCVFVMKCSKTLPMVKQEAGDRRSRLGTYKTTSGRLRSRAKSQLNKLRYFFRVLPRQAP